MGHKNNLFSSNVEFVTLSKLCDDVNNKLNSTDLQEAHISTCQKLIDAVRALQQTATVESTRDIEIDVTNSSLSFEYQLKRIELEISYLALSSPRINGNDNKALSAMEKVLRNKINASQSALYKDKTHPEIVKDLREKNAKIVEGSFARQLIDSGFDYPDCFEDKLRTPNFEKEMMLSIQEKIKDFSHSDIVKYLMKKNAKIVDGPLVEKLINEGFYFIDLFEDKLRTSEFEQRVIERSPQALEFAGIAVKNDPVIVGAVIARRREMAKYMGASLKQDLAFAHKMVSKYNIDLDALAPALQEHWSVKLAKKGVNGAAACVLGGGALGAMLGGGAWLAMHYGILVNPLPIQDPIFLALTLVGAGFVIGMLVGTVVFLGKEAAHKEKTKHLPQVEETVAPLLTITPRLSNKAGAAFSPVDMAIMKHVNAHGEPSFLKEMKGPKVPPRPSLKKS